LSKETRENTGKLGTTITGNTSTRGELRKPVPAASSSSMGGIARSRRKSSSIASRDAAFAAANAAEAKKGHGTLVLDVQQVTVLADYFVITGGDSASQVRAIAESIRTELLRFGLHPRAIEGQKEARWILMDYEQIIVHILQERERNYYKLEQFWNHALIVDRDEWLEDVSA
jgi:ribosome-associated protein